MIKNILYILIITLLGTHVSTAANHHVRADASGTGTGENWINAYTELPSILVRDDTYYIADGTYPSHRFNDVEIDSTYITIKKATVADHGDTTGWLDSYGDDQAIFDETINFTTGYYIWDGVAGTADIDSTYGFKIVYEGTPSEDTFLVGMPGLGYSRFTVHHITFSYTCAKTQGSVYDFDQMCVYSLPRDSTYTAHDITISHNLFGNGSSNIFMRYWDDCIIEYNYFDSNWSSATSHGQQISPGYCENIILRNNTFNESSVFLIGWHAMDNTGWKIYNNIATDGEVTALWGNADSGYTDVAKNNEVHHNTAIGVDMGGRGNLFIGLLSSLDYKSRAYNNIFISCVNPRMDNVAGSYTDGAIVHDYNAYYNCSGVYNSGTHDIVSFTPAPIESIILPYDLRLTKSVDGIVADSLNITRATDFRDSTVVDPPDRGAFEFTATEAAGDTIIAYIYIAPDGNDTTGDGSIDNPYLTLAKAQAIADSGDVIWLKANGVYSESFVFPSAHITLSSYGVGSLPLISGYKALSGWDTFESIPDTSAYVDTVSVAGDDVIVSGSNLYQQSSNTMIACNKASVVYDVYLKHNNATIPQGATILSAKETLFITSGDATGTKRITVSAYDSLTAPQITTASWFNGSPLTTATVDIDPGVTSDNTPFDIDGIGSPIQEVINREDWASGNSIGIFIKDRTSDDDAYLRWAAAEHDSTGAILNITYSTGGDADTTKAYYILSGEELNFINVLIGGTLGTEVVYDSLDTTGEYTVSNDTLYIIKADTLNVKIPSLDYGIDLNGQTNITIKNIKINGYNRSGILADGDNCLIENVVLDSLRMFIDISGLYTVLNHVTINGGLVAADSLSISASAITNCIVDAVANVDTTGGYNGSYNNWYGSGDQPAGVGDTIFDLQLGIDNIPDSLSWDERATGTPKEYYGALYYPIGIIEVTYPNGGETFNTGDTINVTWNATENIGNVIVEYIHGSSIDSADTLLASTGMTSLADITHTTVQGYISIKSVDDVLTIDESDSYFYVTDIALEPTYVIEPKIITPYIITPYIVMPWEIK